MFLRSAKTWWDCYYQSPRLRYGAVSRQPSYPIKVYWICRSRNFWKAAVASPSYMSSVAKVRFFLHIPTHFWKISYGLIGNYMFEGSTLLIQFTGFCVLRMRKSVCARCLSVMTRRRVSALVTAPVLSVGCSASIIACRAVGRQEAREKAASIIKAILQIFIVLISS